jgi:chromosome segregation ATPase
MDSWEEGFDKWTPRTPNATDAGDDTGTDLDRAELLRLARELAERRQTGRTGADAEVEQLKQALRERAGAVAARERELAELQRRLESDRPGVRGLLELRSKRGERSEAVDSEALAARERATHERAQTLDERERAAEARERSVQAQAAELEAEAARLAERERELAGELKAAEAKLAETEAERKLATAERERLEERDRAVHDREKELATVGVEIEGERQELEARVTELEARTRELDAQAAAVGSAAEHGAQQVGSVEREAAAKLAAVEERERTLARRESKLDARERDLALVRQGLDAERNALLERERGFRRREVAEVRESRAQPFAPPSFSEGLAALARVRSRG